MFSHDTKEVLVILKELTVDTDDETWTKRKRCGWEAMLELQNNRDGKSEGERRKQVDKADPKRIFYRNETNFSFKNYITKKKQTLNMLENYNLPLYE